MTYKEIKETAAEIGRISGWSAGKIREEIDKLVVRHTMTTPNGKKKRWLTRKGAAWLLLLRLRMR